MGSILLRYFEDDGRRARVRAGLFRAVAFAIVWWALVDGELSSWPFGLAFVAASVAASLMLAEPGRAGFSALGLAKFLYVFLLQSFIGAVDVAWRALHPRLRLDPALHAYSLRLPRGRERVLFANVVSLLPGTLSAELRADALLVHVLDETRPFLQELTALEDQIGQLYGHDLGGPGTGDP